MEQEIDITLNDQEECDCHHTDCHCHKDEDDEDTPPKSTTPVVYEELNPDDFDDWD